MVVVVVVAAAVVIVVVAAARVAVKLVAYLVWLEPCTHARTYVHMHEMPRGAFKPRKGKNGKKERGCVRVRACVFFVGG